MTSSQRTAQLLSVTSAAVSLGVTGWDIAQAGGLTPFSVCAGLAGLASIGSAVFIRRFTVAGEQEVLAMRTDVEGREQELQRSLQELEQFKSDVTTQLEQRTTQLNAREQHVAQLQVSFSEWLEYPQPGQPIDVLNQLEQRQLTDKDQQVLKRIEEESQQLYKKLREGYYKPDGAIDAKRIREDVHEFVLSVAKIYRPESANPLLETSVDQLLRAASRACLHLLVVLERLPFNPKDMSISTLHGYVQTALKAYDAYVAAKPYLGYVQTAGYVGRWLAGATPLTLGVSWLIGELGKRGTKAAAQWLIDQQAVALLHEVTRVIGFEVASLFSGEFRHRDANWVFASELTHLMSLFPLSRDNLAQALREVGSLTFRNEYDRIFVYRCLSTHRSPQPLAMAHQFLSLSDREQVGKRLERFFQGFIHGKQPRLVDDWTQGVETRLGIKLTAALPIAAARESSPEQDRLTCLRALAGFLLSIKAVPLEEVADRLVMSELFRQLDDQQRAAFVDSMLAEPPSFEVPDVDVSQATVAPFVADLTRLSVRSRPWDVQPDELLFETAVMLGQDFEKTKKLVAREYSDALATLLSKDAVASKLDGKVARAALAELQSIGSDSETTSDSDEPVLFCYSSGNIVWPSSVPALSSDRRQGLIGTSRRLLLIEADERDAVVATHELGGVTIERVNKMINDECRLTGTRWTMDGHSQPLTISVQLAGTIGTRYETSFKPLLDLALTRRP